MLKESPPSPTMMGYSSPLSGFLLEGTSNKSRVSSFHHSDSSWDFDFDSFSDVPVYDEATTPTTPATTERTSIATTSCYMQKLPWEEDTKKKKKKKNNNPRELDFNSSWPSARHMLAKTTTTNNNKPTKSKSKKCGNSNGLDSNSNHGPSSCAAACDDDKDSRPPSATQSKGVRFAPTKVVRTHTLVLGDHPMCEDGLALQLGWDFTESKDIIKPLSNANGGWNIPRWRRILRPTAPLGMEGPAKLLSLQERKKLLKEVAGCTDDELEKRHFCARYLSDYAAFHKPSPPRKQPPKLTSSNTNSNKSFTNMKNFSANSSSSTTTTKNNKNKNSGRGSSNGCRDPPPTPSSQRVRTSNETPIARPRRRSLNRRSSQPHYAARMA